MTRYDGVVKKVLWLTTFLAGVSLTLNFYFYHQLDYYKKTEGKFKVREVLDGDTLVIDLGQAVRLNNVDAPALDLCFGQEAKDNLEKLVLGKYVRIESTTKDKFGRTLGKVYLDDELINETVTRSGWAKYSTGTPADEARERIKKGAEEAKEKGLGVWNQRCYQTENLEKPECRIKGNIGKSDGRKVYHFPGCNEYERTVVELDQGEEWFCSEKEALRAGYEKSEHCYGKEYKTSS